MGISLFKASRTVLLISDQALYIYSTSSKESNLVEVVPWTAQNFEKNVAAIISKECGNTPILILNDMVEQHYRKERIPRVSVFDKTNVVNRKLLVTFPSYPIRAAFPLNEKVAKTDKKIGDVYIFTAVPASDPLSKTMAAARISTASIAGFCLLPVESADMVKRLGDKFFPKEKAKWTVFVGQHQSGGLRQIVTKNGQLALTRMTPITETQDNVDQWAGEVYQEFKATMSYLSRFGYDSSEGLNFVFSGNVDLGQKIEDLLDIKCNYKSATLSDAASVLGLTLFEGDDLGYADLLHAAWAGTKAKLSLPMKAKELESFSKPRSAAIAVSLLLFLGLSFQSYQSFSFFQNMSLNHSEIETSIQRKSELDIQYQKEVKKKEDLGFDIQLIQSSLAINEELLKNDIDSLDLFYRIGAALSKEMRIDSLDIERALLRLPSPDEQTSADGSKPKRTTYVAKLQLSFPSTMDAEKGNKEVEDLKISIQKLIPDSIVKITKLLEDYQYSKELIVQTGDIKNQTSAQDYVAEIRIEKQSND